MARFASFSAFFPTSWLVELLPAVDSTLVDRLLYGSGFVAMTIGCPVAAFYLFRGRFRQLWMIAMEAKRRGGQKRSMRHVRTEGYDLHVTGTIGNTRAIMLKESRVLRREPHVWIGLVIPLALFPVFILLRVHEQSMPSIYIILVSVLATASYTLSCIGREGRSFHLLRSLPMGMGVVLRAKFLLGCAVNLAVTLGFVVALYMTRQSSLSQVWQNSLIAAVASIYLSAFGTALAALFPKFDFTNPMRAASLPGIFTLYLLSFIFAGTFIGAMAASWYFVPLVLVPWAGVALILMKVARERLERMDI
jgi:hypothetical protein